MTQEQRDQQDTLEERPEQGEDRYRDDGSRSEEGDTTMQSMDGGDRDSKGKGKGGMGGSQGDDRQSDRGGQKGGDDKGGREQGDQGRGSGKQGSKT